MEEQADGVGILEVGAHAIGGAGGEVGANGLADGEHFRDLEAVHPCLEQGVVAVRQHGVEGLDAEVLDAWVGGLNFVGGGVSAIWSAMEGLQVGLEGILFTKHVGIGGIGGSGREIQVFADGCRQRDGPVAIAQQIAEVFTIGLDWIAIATLGHEV